MNNQVKIHLFNQKKEMIFKLRNIIEEFCRKNKLILYGGLALDRILKANGHIGIYGSYDDYDYDVLSLNYLEDSKELGTIMYESGINHVKVHSGMNPTTRKINILYLGKAIIDINHMDVEQLLQMKPIELDGLLYVPPEWLFSDFYKNLSNNLFGDIYRLPKVIERLPILTKMFPQFGSEEAYLANRKNSPEIPTNGILCGDFVFNFYYENKFFGEIITYAEGGDLEMDGETAYEIAKINGNDYRIAPKVLLLYIYYFLKIRDNTDKYDFQIMFLTRNGIPFLNYKEVKIYTPKYKKPPHQQYAPNVLLPNE